MGTITLEYTDGGGPQKHRENNGKTTHIDASSRNPEVPGHHFGRRVEIKEMKQDAKTFFVCFFLLFLGGKLKKIFQKVAGKTQTGDIYIYISIFFFWEILPPKCPKHSGLAIIQPQSLTCSLLKNKNGWSPWISGQNAIFSGVGPSTPLKFNIVSENGWLEYDPFLLGFGLFSGSVTFQGRTVKLQEVWYCNLPQIRWGFICHGKGDPPKETAGPYFSGLLTIAFPRKFGLFLGVSWWPWVVGPLRLWMIVDDTWITFPNVS